MFKWRFLHCLSMWISDLFLYALSGSYFIKSFLWACMFMQLHKNGDLANKLKGHTISSEISESSWKLHIHSEDRVNLNETDSMWGKKLYCLVELKLRNVVFLGHVWNAFYLNFFAIHQYPFQSFEHMETKEFLEFLTEGTPKFAKIGLRLMPFSFKLVLCPLMPLKHVVCTDMHEIFKVRAQLYSPFKAMMITKVFVFAFSSWIHVAQIISCMLCILCPSKFSLVAL
jgi:hypothetical protein